MNFGPAQSERKCAARHDAGYEAAKCRFFLTATRRMNGAAAVQMMLEAATPK